MEKLIKLENVTKNFDTLQVLQKTSFHLNRGEVVCLLGPSGSGKSTLFNIIAGLEEVDEGEVYIDSEIRTGYVFQHPRLLPWKTVTENIKFVQKNYLKAKRAQQIREWLLDLNGLGDFKDSYPTTLSGGMKQRVEIIRGLSIWPGLLLMDEPFKSVDAQMKINLREMILRFSEILDLSVLLITHDPEEAVLMADRIYILSEKSGKMKEEYKIDIPQHKRTLNNEQVFQIMEEIIDLFNQLVQDYSWEANEKTRSILNKMGDT